MAKKKPQSISASVGGDLSGNLIIGDGNRIQINAPASPRLDSYTPLPFPPLNELLEPADFLPPDSRMPFHRNRVFTGRKTDLLALAQSLVTHHASAATAITQAAAATGMGGIGKTQLAVEFCYRYGCYFHGVHWINAREGSLDSEIAACGREMALPNFPETTPEQVALTLREWQKQPLRLLVLDNLEEPKVLSEWLPRLNGLHLLVTARRPQWSADLGVEVHPLDTLPRPDSLALLRKLAPRLKDMSNADFDPLAERLGDLPLALDLAGRYLNARPTLTVAGYLQRLDETGNALEHTSLAGWVKDASPTAHETSLAATFLLSWKRLGNTEVDKLAKQFFISSGYLATNIPIHRDIFAELIKNKEKDLVDDGIIRLKELGLLSETLTIHSLLAEFAKNQDQQKKQLLILSDNISYLSLILNDLGNPTKWATMLRPHVEALVFSLDEDNPNLGTIWNNLGFHYWEMAEFNSAKRALEKAIKISIGHFGENHPETAASINNLGLLMRSTGELNKAKKLFENALSIWMSEYGNIHLKIAKAANNLGIIHLDLNEIEQAKELLNFSFSINKELFGENSQEMISNLMGLGYLSLKVENPERARHFFEQALSIMVNHKLINIQLATIYNNLGVIYSDLGDYDKAKLMFNAAIGIDETIFGKEHLETSIKIQNFAMFLHSRGESTQAKRLLDQALKIQEKTFGEKHIQIVRVISNLAEVVRVLGEIRYAEQLQARANSIIESAPMDDLELVSSVVSDLAILKQEFGDLNEARELFEKALKIDVELHGASHEKVARDYHHLSGVLREMGDLHNAKFAIEQAITIFDNFHEPEYKDKSHLSFALHNLALIHKDMRNFDEAQKLFEQILEMDIAKFGYKHPSVARDLSNYGSLFYEEMRLRDAKDKLEQSLEIYEETIGLENLETAATMGNLGNVLADLGDTDAAINIYHRALEIEEKIIGAEHPRLATSLHSLATSYYEKGNISMSRFFEMRAFRILKKFFKLDHPKTQEVKRQLKILEKYTK